MFLAETFRVILLLGDDLNEFIAGVRGDPAMPTRRREMAERNSSYWGTKWIILPNPTYGSWEIAFCGAERL